MRISLIGFGKMGQEIYKIAEREKIIVSSIIDPHHQKATCSGITHQSLKNTDVAIDFTHPDTILENIEKAAKEKVNLVIGTTGWLDILPKVEKIVKKNHIGLIYGSNFSIGVHLFWQILEEASKKFNLFPQYDIFGHEFHHNKKADSPSGTAQKSAQIILKNIKRKKTLQTNILNRPPKPNELHFTSTRGGYIPGTHSIYFDSEADTLEITHQARSRAGFALGAIQCAKWIKGKTGLYTIEDYIKEL